MISRAPLLVVGNFLSSSGGTRGVCEELAERLKKRGWSVRCTSRRHSRVLRLGDMLWTAWSLREGYKVAQVDVFSGPAFLWAELVCLTLRLAGRPYVLTLHGGNLPHFARRWPGRVRRLLESATQVTAPSRYLQQALEPFRSGIILLPNALDIGCYDFQLRRKPRPKLIWLRAFHYIYNPQLAIRTVALLRDEFADVRLTMIGPDKKDGSLKHARELAVKLGVANRITFIAGVSKSEVPARLQSADIFLNTSRIDNMPVSVVEAMACGLCVVSTAVGGISHLVSDGEDALLAPDDDAGAMAAAVRRIVNDHSMATHLSLNARHKAEQLDWEIILNGWESVLAHAAEGTCQ